MLTSWPTRGHAPRSTSTFTQFRRTWKTGSGDRGNTTPIRKPRRCAERIVGEAVEPYLRPSSPTYRREIIDSFGGRSGEVDVIFRNCVPSRWPADCARQHPQTGYSGPTGRCTSPLTKCYTPRFACR